MRLVLIAAALLTAAPVAAQAPASRLVLAEGVAAPTGRVVVDGATWRCEGSTCTATGGASQPAPRACRRVAQRLGRVAAFNYRGADLTAEQVAACNA
jgi:hypothetical protein